MNKKVMTSYAATQLLMDIIIENGMRPDDLALHTGVNKSQIKNPDARIPMGPFLKLWQVAIDITGDPALALRLRRKVGLQYVHFVGSLACYSINLLEGAYHCSRYAKLVSDADKFDVFDDGRLIKIIYTNIFPEYQNRWIPEHHFSLSLDVARSLTENNFDPVEVHFQHIDPGYTDVYDEVFRAPVFFQQPENMIVYKKPHLLQPISARDPNVRTALKNYAELLLKEQVLTESLQGKVCNHIIKCLPDGGTTIKQTSKALNMDSSTLYRQLKRGGETFSSLLLKTRQEQAKKYLHQGLTNSQVAYLLGFSEPSNFQHAFKRWFAISPGVYRKSLSI